jgi:hypothetical protein
MARSKKPNQRIRVREIPLDRIDEGKLALAFWLMAKRRIEEEDEAAQEQSAP